MSTVGTWAWAEATHGRLRRRDIVHQLHQGVIARLASMPDAWRRDVLGTQGSLALPDPPDSGLARLAEERVRELSSPALYGHCLRTWLFAALFAQRDAVRHDQELLYLACVLHDLGLTDAHDQHDPTAACFAVEGARAAHELLCRNGSAEGKATRVAEAISLHLNVTVPERLGAEAHLLSKGVSLDVVGRYAHQLPAAALLEVNTHWPREGFSEYLVATTTRQAQIRGQSRSALLRRLGFNALVEANRLDRA